MLDSKFAGLINICVEHPPRVDLQVNYINSTSVKNVFVRQLLFAVLVGQLGQQLFALCAQCAAAADA